MSDLEISDKPGKRRRSGKKSQKISFDEEIVPKSIAQQFNIPPIKSKELEPQKKKRNKTKQKIVVESSNTATSESEPKIQKRKKKPPQEKEKIENTEVIEPLDEQLHEDTEIEPSKPVVKEESIRARKRKKYQKLLLDNKVKVDLVLQEKSLNYLSRWKHNQSEWKFEKLRQVWLQQNMFDCDRVPDRLWTTLVEYFSGAKGQIRKTIIDEALTIIKQNEHELNNEEDTEKQSEDENNIIKAQRAKDIIQSLQE